MTVLGPALPASATALVSMQGISKTFGENRVLRGISFDVMAGEVHALLGENGAGKSTLMKVLMGVYPADDGRIVLDGKDISGSSVQEHLTQGIAMIFQELSLLPNLTVAQNLLLGREPCKSGWRINTKALRDEAKTLIEQYDFSLQIDAYVRNLSFAQRQMVEVLKAVSRGARVLIMDEPTSSLSLREETQLFGIIQGLQARGMGIVYISHRMAEVFQIATRISIVKDGQLIGPLEPQKSTMQNVANLMSKSTGGALASQRLSVGVFDRTKPVLRVEGLNTKKKLKGLSFEVARGEVVGIAGLVGSGRSTLAKALFGLLADVSGTIALNGKPLPLGNPIAAIAAGVGFVPEDRRSEGLVLGLSLATNVALPGLATRCGSSRVSRVKELGLFSDFQDRLKIVYRRHSQPASELSGGNQQKVVFAKWLATQPRLLILDEPTNGVDVNAKADMRAVIRTATESGIGVLLISSELDELVAAADRVLLMIDGRITRELTNLGSEGELRGLLQHDIETSRNAPRSLETKQ